MISFYDASGEKHPLTGYEEFCITHKQDGCDTMTFQLDVKHELYQMLYEECCVETDDNRWLIKKIDDDKFDCELDFDFLRERFYRAFRSETKLLAEVLAAHLPAGWTVDGASQSVIRRTIEFDFCTDYDVIYECMSTYKVYFIWNMMKKRLTVVVPENLPSTGEYLTSELNLRSLSFKGDTTDFCTRLYCYGKEGMTIEDAMVDDGAGGKKRYGLQYIENRKYSDKIVCGFWSDERYTVPENLYADGLERLETLANPVRSYECDVVDLAKMSPEYSFLEFIMHRRLTLVDVDKGIKVEHSIVEYAEWPDEDDRNKVTLSCVPGTIQGSIEGAIKRAVASASEEAGRKVESAKELLNEKIMMATAMMTGAFGSYLYTANGELFMMDDPDPARAKIVWRWNVNGFAKSSSGIDGPYTTAMLWNDEFITGVITAMVVNATIITTGILQSVDGETFFLDLDNGILRMKATSLQIGGKTVEKIAEDASAGILDKALTQSEIARRLTNDWKAKGIYLEGTELYINASYLRAGVIDLALMRLAGTLCGIIREFGSTATGVQTEGLAIYGNGLNSDNHPEPPYLMVTNKGIRGQLSGGYQFNYSGGSFEVYGLIGVHKVGGRSGTIYAEGDITTGGTVWLGKNLSTSSVSVNAYTDETHGVNIAGWSYLSDAAWVGDGSGSRGLVLHGSRITSDVDVTVTSDRAVKKDIEPLDGSHEASPAAMGDAGVEGPSLEGTEVPAAEEDLAAKYEAVLDYMTPVRFRYKTEGDDQPYHLGYIAQDVEAAIAAAGLDPVDMGTVRETVDEKGNKLLGIAYGELTALLHLKLKRQEERLAEQEKRIEMLEALVEKLTGREEVAP